MDISDLLALQTPMGQEALSAAVSIAPLEKDFLRHYQTLARHFPENVSRAALETAILRQEGAIKFPFAEKMFFTRQALEQASGWEVSNYRVERYIGFDRVFDLGCSIGGDTLALCKVAPTTGIDLDELRLHMAKLNCESLDLQDQVNFLQADLKAGLPFKKFPGREKWACFFDPARRKAERRIFSVDDYSPPLNIINEWIEYIPAFGVKISPGVDMSEIQSYDAEVEFISLRGELKETVLWFGLFKSTRRRATLLPGREMLCEEYSTSLPLSEPQAFIYEPDPAVLRAGLVATLGARLDAFQLDPMIAYLTTPHLIATPFARAWKIETWFPFGLKRLRNYLRQQGVGKVTVKKRGSPLEPQALIHDLHLQGEQERVVFLTQLNGKPVSIVAYPEIYRPN
ncbi:MAG: hypothetical protein JW908_05370 [Anaerolineales bacterium]|nr:hypothetical protein [Anaerolineales bacterium]